MEIGLCMSDKLFTFCLSTRKAAQCYTRYQLMASMLKWVVEKEPHVVFLWWYKAGNSSLALTCHRQARVLQDKPNISHYRQVAKLLLGIVLLFSLFPGTWVACRCSHFGLGTYVWILNIVWHNPYLPRLPCSSIIIFTKVKSHHNHHFHHHATDPHQVVGR